MKAREITSMPQSEASRLVDFEDAELIQGINPNEPPILVVSGTKPCINMEVRLIPRVYVRQPEYWEIEVVGVVPGGICLEAVAPYHVTLDRTPLGTQGVEVVGATKSEKLQYPPE